MKTKVIESPATVSVPEAGKILGIGRGLAYEAARRGEIPTIRIGGRLLVPTSRLCRLLDGTAPPKAEAA